jgi:hypothetical protein
LVRIWGSHKNPKKNTCITSLIIRVGKNKKYIKAKNNIKLLAPLLALRFGIAFSKTLSTYLCRTHYAYIVSPTGR